MEKTLEKKKAKIELPDPLSTAQELQKFFQLSTANEREPLQEFKEELLWMKPDEKKTMEIGTKSVVVQRTSEGFTLSRFRQ